MHSEVLLDQLYGCSLEYDNQGTSCRNAMRSQYTDYRPNFQTQTGACPDGDTMEWPKATDDELSNSRCSKHAKNTLVGYAPSRTDGPPFLERRRYGDAGWTEIVAPCG